AVGQVFFIASPERTDLVGLQQHVANTLGMSPRVVHVWPWLLKAAAAAADGITNATGRRLPLNRKLASQLLAPGWTCQVGKAKALLGFEAAIPLAESVARATRWYREQ